MGKSKRKGSRKGLYLFILFLLVLLGSSSYFIVQQTVLGEEGYRPYDPQLPTGTYDRTLWFYTPCASCGGFVEYNAPACVAAREPYLGVSVVDGKLQHNGIGTCSEGGGAILRTKDLRLQDFKTSVRLYTTNTRKNFFNECFYSSKGSLFCHGGGTGTTGKPDTSFYELTWDDYKLGHYQIKRNGVVVQEGNVPEGEEFYLYTRPHVEWECCPSPSFQGTDQWIDPRIREVFSCDLQEDEVRVVQTWDKKGLYDISDLRGWKRFCVDIGSYHDIGGAATTSEQVYYSLASGEVVELFDNEFWEIAYIADRDKFGLDDETCEFYNVEGGKCTGSVHVCNNFVEGLGCVTVVEDEVDIPVPDPVIQNQTLSWTSYGRWDFDEYKNLKRTLRSGDIDFMTTSDVRINEGTCPYEEGWLEYPKDRKLSSSCYTVDSFGYVFHEGESRVINTYLKVTLDKLTVRYKLDDEGKQYRWAATWKLEFQPDGVVIEQLKVPGIVRHTEEVDLTARVKNNLPANGLFLTTILTRQTSIQEEVSRTAETRLNVGQTATLSAQLKTDVLGQSEVLVWNTLQTDVGGVAFQLTKSAYKVDGNYSDPSIPGSDDYEDPDADGTPLGFWFAVAGGSLLVLIFTLWAAFRKKK